MSLCVVVLALLMADEKPKPKAGDEAKLNGTWKVTATTFNGNEVATESLKGRTLVIADGTLTGYVNGKKGNVNKLTFDAKKKPAHVNLLRQGLKEESLGIYKLSGDKLTLCYGEPGAERPEAFESKEGGKVFLLVLEQVKKE